MGAPTLAVRPFAVGDETAICALYNHYIVNTTVTFEEQPLSVEAMRVRIEAYIARYAWWVAECEGEIVGYCYAAPFHARSAYRYTAEVTVYVHPDKARQGIGRALYTSLFAQLKASGYRVLIAILALPNEASTALHEHCGFVKVGHLTAVGFKFGRWLDVGHWQKQL